MTAEHSRNCDSQKAPGLHPIESHVAELPKNATQTVKRNNSEGGAYGRFHFQPGEQNQCRQNQEAASNAKKSGKHTD